MTATATMTNGKPQRKQLADQLDRLDGIIDTLSEGLNEAVADACRESARAAVRDAIIEIVSNPELRAMLAPQYASAASTASAATPTAHPPEPKKPGIWGRIKARVAAARDAAANVVTRVKEAVIRRCVVAGDAVVALGHATGEPLPVKRTLLVGLGVGLVVGVACLVVPQTTAALIGGAGATCTAIAVQTGKWLTNAARRVGLLN